jgi:predicted metal-dependent hydrolase
MDQRFDEAVRLFDAGEYFACHDVLEDLWSETYGEERDFLQGLIHASVALFHFTEGNLGGARKMFESQQKYLRPYGASYGGINLELFQTQMSGCFHELGQHQGGYPTGMEFDPQRTPCLAACRLEVE